MVFNVRCFKCGEQDVRLVLGGRSIIHAQCHACDTNLLAEVMEFQNRVESGDDPDAEHPAEENEPDDTFDPIDSDESEVETVQPGNP